MQPAGHQQQHGSSRQPSQGDRAHCLAELGAVLHAHAGCCLAWQTWHRPCRRPVCSPPPPPSNPLSPPPAPHPPAALAAAGSKLPHELRGPRRGAPEEDAQRGACEWGVVWGCACVCVCVCSLHSRWPLLCTRALMPCGSCTCLDSWWDQLSTPFGTSPPSVSRRWPRWHATAAASRPPSSPPPAAAARSMRDAAWWPCTNRRCVALW